LFGVGFFYLSCLLAGCDARGFHVPHTLLDEADLRSERLWDWEGFRLDQTIGVLCLDGIIVPMAIE
jgi:hypothetical protein